MPSLTSRTTVQSNDTLRANTRANARAAIREDETGRLLALTQSEHACSKSFSEQPKCLARHTRHTPRPTDTPEGMLAAQDEVAEKARALWGNLFTGIHHFCMISVPFNCLLKAHEWAKKSFADLLRVF